MIKQLTESDIGSWVTYSDGFKTEKGKIKRFNNERQTAFVVYHCNEEWGTGRWDNYTAASTKYANLTLQK